MNKYIRIKPDGKRTSEYKAWSGMKDRCFNPNSNKWKYYGGRGITVCARWRNSYENFIDDMGLKPSSDLSIDRINNDGNYEPGNCRWATIQQQNNNQRRIRMFTDNSNNLSKRNRISVDNGIFPVANKNSTRYVATFGKVRIGSSRDLSEALSIRYGYIYSK